MQRCSETIGALAGALAKAQAELTNPEKSLVATLPVERAFVHLAQRLQEPGDLRGISEACIHHRRIWVADLVDSLPVTGEVIEGSGDVRMVGSHTRG